MSESMKIHPEIRDKLQNAIKNHNDSKNPLVNLLKQVVESIAKTAKTVDDHYSSLVIINNRVNHLIKRVDALEKKLESQ